MIMSGLRTGTFAALLTVLVAVPSVGAQQLDDPAQQTPPPATPPQTTGQKVAAAEEPAKPTRSFFPALFHNLGDDIKHIPRKNTLYWLGAGTVASLVIHPADDYMNDHLSTSDT